MIRFVLLLVVVSVIGAAEPAAAAVAARTQAEQALADSRARIFAERRVLMADVQAALTEVERQRALAATATHAHDVANADLLQLRSSSSRDRDALQIEVEKALISARVPTADLQRLRQESLTARATAAATALEQRTAALTKRLGLHLGPEMVVGRDGSVTEIVVLRLGDARAIAFASKENFRGYLSRTADDAVWMVGGPALPPEVVLTTAGAPAVIPLDLDPTSSSRVLAKRRTLGEWLRAGRFFIWPILAVLAGGLIIALERVVTLYRLSVDPRRLAEMRAQFERGEAQAVRAASATRATSLDRVIASTLEAPAGGRESLIDAALLAEAQPLQRGLGAILVLAGVAPLLGLLGTVTGMIDLFAVIGEKGATVARSLSGGISEALISTQAGLLTAIPLLLIHALLNRLAERRMMLLEQAAAVAAAHAVPPSPTIGAT